MESEKGKLPHDPVILLSFINTALRDKYSTLDEFITEELSELNRGEREEKKKEIIDTLKKIDYTYDKEKNAFI